MCGGGAFLLRTQENRRRSWRAAASRPRRRTLNAHRVQDLTTLVVRFTRVALPQDLTGVTCLPMAAKF